MKKYIQYLALFTSIVLASSAFAVNVGLLAGAGGAVETCTDTADFTGPAIPADMTLRYGSCVGYDFGGDEDTIRCAGDVRDKLYLDTQLGSISQYVKYEAYDVRDTNAEMGSLLRGQSDGTGTHYVVFVRDDDCYVRVNSAGGHVKNVADSQFPGPDVLEDGEWVGFMVSADTGDDVDFSCWIWAADPGDYGDWGAADVTFTDVDMTGSEVDTGDYAGIHHKNDGGAGYNRIDNTCIGDL